MSLHGFTTLHDLPLYSTPAICLRISPDNDTEMSAAKCGNEIRHLFLNYNALMGKDRGGRRVRGRGEKGRVCTGKLD